MPSSADSQSPGPPRDERVPRTLYRRLVFRRQFLGQLPIIVAHRWRTRDRAGTAFVSLMGGSATW